mmetsp:Transcript_8442/g.12582  ORF Transcript_8442/g.12582 Transcript_8442/m.12582 type:complete len:471 (+) Transcript_8442:76-1488(+)
MNDTYITCETEGVAALDTETGFKFFNSVIINGCVISISDCVKIRLEEPDDAGEMFAFGQILAIFEDTNNNEGVEIETRWFLKPAEVDLIKKKKIKVRDNEILESPSTADIAAGAIMCKISIVDAGEVADDVVTKPQSRKRTRRSVTEEVTENSMEHASELVCRFLCTETNDALIPVQVKDMWSRGKAYSEYSHIYQSSGEKNDSVDPVAAADPYSRAVSKLHVSVQPTELPCRMEEQKRVYEFLKGAVRVGGRAGSSRRPLYISGMPGTGKTATVHAAISMLKQDLKRGQVRQFEFVEINGLRIPTPNDAYTVLWRGISGEHLSHKTALARLKSHFAEEETMSASDVDERPFVICLLDELDYLVTTSESVVYNLFQWPQQPASRLILIGIANTMDLPERLSRKSLSRMGGQHLVRMAFRAYTHEQVLTILSHRLENLGDVFDKKSLEFTARKAAAAAGDLRSALKICQRY